MRRKDRMSLVSGTILGLLAIAALRCAFVGSAGVAFFCGVAVVPLCIILAVISARRKHDITCSRCGYVGVGYHSEVTGSYTIQHDYENRRSYATPDTVTYSTCPRCGGVNTNLRDSYVLIYALAGPVLLFCWVCAVVALFNK